MMTILGFLTSSAFGTITGSLFSWLNKREERAELKMKLEHDQVMAQLANEQAKQMAVEGRATIREAGEQAVAKAEADAFTVSQQAANQKPTGKWAELIWSAIRPIITLYLLISTSIIAYRLSALIGGFSALPVADIIETYKVVINEVLALTGYAVGWWFGARGSSKRKG